MPQQLWEVTHPTTGKPVQIPFDHEPSDQELDAYFAEEAGGVPVAPQGASQFIHTAPSKIGITRDLTTLEKIRQNLPAIGGVLGGIAGMGMGGWPAVVTSGLGATIGKEGQDVWRSLQGLPTPPTAADTVGEALTSGVQYGMVPEAAGRLLGKPIGALGDAVSRIGSEARNARAFESAANPKGLKVSRTGNEVGQQVQTQLKINQENAQQPLSEKYDNLLGGQFGKSREFVVFRDPKTGQMMKAPVGDQIAQMHQDRSDLLATGLTQKESSTALAPRRRGAAVKAANETLARIEKTAKDHGLSADEYINLSNQWRAVQEQYANPMMRQVQSKAGGNVLDQLSRPQSWKSFIRTGGTSKLDHGQLADRFMQTLDPGMQEKAKAAITKRLVNADGSVNGQVVPAKLLAALDRIEKYGVTDKLVNNADALRSYAEALAKYDGAPQIPGVMWKASFVNKLLEKGLGDPDVQRMAWRMRGERGAGQKLAEILGQFAVLAPQYEDTTTENPIPQPPR